MTEFDASTLEFLGKFLQTFKVNVVFRLHHIHTDTPHILKHLPVCPSVCPSVSSLQPVICSKSQRHCLLIVNHNREYALTAAGLLNLLQDV